MLFVILLSIVAIAFGCLVFIFSRIIILKKIEADKNRRLYLTMARFVQIHHENKSIKSYFSNNNINTLAIYGMDFIGEALYQELRNSDVIVKYAIDRNAKNIYSSIPVLLPSDTLEKVDVIVVTAIGDFDKIKNKLMTVVDYSIISIEDVLNGVG